MRYISDLNISFSLLVDGVDKRFSFSPCGRGGSMYIARSEAEIRALEKSPMYGRVYRRMEGQEDIPVKSSSKGGKRKKAPQMQDIPGINTWQEAIEYLVSLCGSDRADLMTPEDILSEASANGIRFTNLNGETS